MHQNHLLNLSLIKTIGEISDKKVNSIVAKGFPLANFVPGEVAQFNGKNGDFIIISKNQISYIPNIAQIDEVLKDQSVGLEIFNTFLDTLLLDGASHIRFDFERSYPADKNTSKKSLELLKDSLPITEIGSEAVGLRIPYRDEYFQGELRIEPFFKDNMRYFLACNLQSINLFQQEQIIEAFSSIIKLVNTKFEPITINLFS